MANITRTEATGFIPSIWANVALGYLANYLTIARCITNYKDMMPGSVFQIGETLKIPKRGTLSVNDKTENANYTLQTPSATTVDLVLNKHKEVSFAIERRALSLVNQDVIGGYVQDAVLKLAEQVDTDIFANYSSAGVTIGTNVAITEANVQAARKQMAVGKVAPGVRKYGIVTPDQVNNLLNIDRLVRYDSVGGNANNIANASVGDGTENLTPSAFGKLYNFEMVESQLVPLSTTYKNLFFAQSAIVFASRPLADIPAGLGVQTVTVTEPTTGLSINLTYAYNASAGAMQCSLEILYGSVVARPEHLALVTTN